MTRRDPDTLNYLGGGYGSSDEFSRTGFARKFLYYIKRQRTRLILSIFFMLFTTACDDAGPWQQRPYYDIYDEAVNLYYKPPRRPEAALALMDRACRENEDKTDVLCYNLGVLRELQERPTSEALAAYRAAYRLRRHPAYLAAIQRLELDPSVYESEYLRVSAYMVQACRANDAKAALKRLREFVRDRTPVQDEAADVRLQRTYRQNFAQPFFADCLESQGAEYQALLEQLAEPRSNPEAFADDIYEARAKSDGFYALWDVELYLRDLGETTDSDHPATAEWQDVLAAARRGRGDAAALHLEAFFATLNELAREEVRKRPASAKALRARVKAMQRAAAVLIRGDSYFARVRGNAKVRAIIAPVLR